MKQRGLLPILLSVGTALAVAVLDYATGDALALSFFYVVPVIGMTRAAGRRLGLPFALFCAALFPLADTLAGAGGEAWLAFWNFAVRGATLLTVVVLVDRLDDALERERDLSRVDPLTRVANLRWFREQAERELARAKRGHQVVALAFIDIDNFKIINDDFGHGAGDDVLAMVGGVLLSGTRSIDLVGRVGGDEFTLLMPDTDLEHATVVIERLRDRLRQELDTRDLPGAISFSIGVVTTDGRGQLDELLLVADQLMYAAKRAGKDQVRSKDLVRRSA